MILVSEKNWSAIHIVSECFIFYRNNFPRRIKIQQKKQKLKEIVYLGYMKLILLLLLLLLFILIKKTLQGLQALQPNNNTKLIIKKNNS